MLASQEGLQTAWNSPSHEPKFTKDLAPDLALPWVVRLRYGIVFGEAAIVLAMTYAFRLDLPLLGTLAPLAIVFCSNLLLHRTPNAFVRFPQRTLGAVFVLDTLCLSVMLAFTGGPANPFTLLYLVQITLSAVVLSRNWTWVLGLLSTVCFGLLFFFHLPLAAFQGHDHPGISPHLVGMWIAFIVAAGLITFFTGRVSDALRRREQEVLTLQEQIAKHERLASLATLAAGAAHELGTPLGTIAVVARELERYGSTLPNPDAVRDDAKLIRSEVERCRLILQRMSAKGAEPLGESARAVPVIDLLNEALGQFSEPQRSSVLMEIADPGLVTVLPVQAAVQSLVALLQNAMDANANGSRVVVKAFAAEGDISFSISDQGTGMSDAVLRRISEPFFTTKEPGRGMGLGTFLVRLFAERLGGCLSFESIQGKGTTATLKLPLNCSRPELRASV